MTKDEMHKHLDQCEFLLENNDSESLYRARQKIVIACFDDFMPKKSRYTLPNRNDFTDAELLRISDIMTRIANKIGDL